MLITTDLAALEQLARDIATVSHAAVSIYDSDRQTLASAGEMQPFCSLVRRDEALAACCLKYDRSGIEECNRTHRLCVYRCHMGLVEVTVPIVDNGYIIGYVQCGQFVDRHDRDAIADEALTRFPQGNIDAEKLRAAVHQLHYHNNEYIRALAHMLESCACYIHLNHILDVSQDSIAYSISRYIHAHLAEPLSQDRLCKIFSISRSALYQISRRHFEGGVMHYVHVCRIEEAKKLLSRGEMRVAEIAEAVGIPDPNYFVRRFRLETGVTPKKYQKTAKK